ncbi:unnamed protein product [Heligmosomoides polygyrus]|uniref:Reverse transcriptase n=1 Tax=Heligmosomoides polygyrus TaxID=6339 RepID=A0A3P8BJJ6_HELPZ|nr:unnamed protein product [Heligmosomoides polygyrus]
METKMLRWTTGVTRMDRIRNDAIRQKFGVAPIIDKMREARLRWYGHVLRGKEDSVRKIGLNFEVIGKRPRGRPKQRWSDSFVARGCGVSLLTTAAGLPNESCHQALDVCQRVGGSGVCEVCNNKHMCNSIKPLLLIPPLFLACIAML